MPLSLVIPLQVWDCRGGAQRSDCHAAIQGELIQPPPRPPRHPPQDDILYEFSHVSGEVG